MAFSTYIYFYDKPIQTELIQRIIYLCLNVCRGYLGAAKQIAMSPSLAAPSSSIVQNQDKEKEAECVPMDHVIIAGCFYQTSMVLNWGSKFSGARTSWSKGSFLKICD